MTNTLDVLLMDPVVGDTAAGRAHALAPLLKALGDENRLTLVLLLAERPHTVRELTDATGMGQTLVSHHLAPLREQGLVTVTPRGRANVYALCCEALVTPMRLLATLASASPAGLDACRTDADCG